MDVRVLKEFVAEVLVACRNDEDEIFWGLDDKAYEAGLELGMTRKEMDDIYLNG